VWGEEPSRGARLFAEALPDTAKYILDVGCGYGRDSLYFASLGYQVTGVDPSKKAVEMAFASVTDPKMNIEFFQDDCLALSFPDANVDAVWCANVLHLFDEGERARAIGEMIRVLKPGGSLGIFVFSTRDQKETKSIHKFSKEELEKLLNTLDIISMEELEEEDTHLDGESHHHVRWLVMARKR